MDNSLKGLMLAAGVIITCIVVGLGFYLSREAQSTGSSAIDSIGGMTSEFQQMDKKMYSGMTVSGREVLGAIEKFLPQIQSGEFCITVCTGKKKEADGGIIFNTSNSDLTEARKKKSDSYINPDGKFTGSVKMDENGVISTLIFVQV